MQEKVGSLNCLRRDGENEKWNVVLLHGFGADSSDLYPLADVLDPEGEWNFYFPQAPLEVAIGPMMSGRGWFPITLRELERGGFDYSKIRPPGLVAAAAAVYDLIFQLNSERLVLGGFSQGAMVATDVALENPSEVSALILFSGTLLDQVNWEKKASGLAGKTLLQSHGTVDTVLPYVGGQRLFELLKAGGMNASMISFGGGHDIPTQVIQRAREFLGTNF